MSKQDRQGSRTPVELERKHSRVLSGKDKTNTLQNTQIEEIRQSMSSNTSAFNNSIAQLNERLIAVENATSYPDPGESGATFIPSVSEDGVISWENDKGLENPAPVNIKGQPGKDGTTFTPSVDTDGNLSWTNNGGLPNPEPVNIKGDGVKIGAKIENGVLCLTGGMSAKVENNVLYLEVTT